MKERRYDLTPFFDATGWTMTQVREIAPSNAGEHRLRRAEGVTERIADRLAVAAGLHPFLVWPDMAEHVIDDQRRECAADDCNTPFVPTAGQRYCTPTCRQRVKMRRYRATPDGAANNRRHRRNWYWECRDYDIAASARRRARRNAA